MQTYIPEDTLIHSNYYLDKNAPFDQVFRNGVSTWTLASPTELKKGLKWWKDEVDAGRAKNFLEQRETIRRLIGQTTSIVAY